MATHSITIERFVQHKTAGWQGVVFAVDGKRHVSTRFMAWELTPSREDALATITSIDDLPKFVEDMSAQYQRNPIIPFVRMNSFSSWVPWHLSDNLQPAAGARRQRMTPPQK